MPKQQEEWKPIFEWENFYEVSNLGRVRSKPRRYWKPDPKMKAGGCWQFRISRVLKSPKNGDGYPNVRLARDGKCFTRKVHRLVWEAFNGPCPLGYHIDHMDGSRDNNNLDNLQAINPQDHKIATLEREQGVPMRREYLDDYRKGLAMNMSKAYQEGFQKALECLSRAEREVKADPNKFRNVVRSNNPELPPPSHMSGPAAPFYQALASMWWDGHDSSREV